MQFESPMPKFLLEFLAGKSMIADDLRPVPVSINCVCVETIITFICLERELCSYGRVRFGPPSLQSRQDSSARK